MRALALSLTIALAACGGSDEPPERGPGSDLAGLPLRPAEAPAGLERDGDAGGVIFSLREVLPPRSAAPQLPPLARGVRRAFVGGYETVYRGTPEQGPTSASSSALGFVDPRAAARFLGYLRGIQGGETTVGSSTRDIELLDAPGLGDQGYVWHRVAPGGETSGCSWRRQEVVLTLTMGGPVGRAGAASALELARTVDSRLG